MTPTFRRLCADVGTGPGGSQISPASPTNHSFPQLLHCFHSCSAAPAQSGDRQADFESQSREEYLGQREGAQNRILIGGVGLRGWQGDGKETKLLTPLLAEQMCLFPRHLNCSIAPQFVKDWVFPT